jgi:signal transduction histidine kinase
VAASLPPPEWLEVANRLATIAGQLSTVVHEANNLLLAASGNAEMLELAPADQDATLRRARVIQEQAQRASALLATVLDFSRDDSIAAERLDLVRLAERAVELRKYALTRQRIAVRFEGEDGLGAAMANRRRTLQIALNLLTNAERAIASRPGATITIRLHREGACVAMTVEDNGGGITPQPDDAPLRAPESEPRTVPRLGIGLRVAAWLALAQHGTLRIATADHGGAAVTLVLPAADATEARAVLPSRG